MQKYVLAEQRNVRTKSSGRLKGMRVIQYAEKLERRVKK
jgi:hypothetical protein